MATKQDWGTLGLLVLGFFLLSAKPTPTTPSPEGDAGGQTGFTITIT